MRGMADWLSAFKDAARTLVRQPTFLRVALVTPALGIGASTANLTVIKLVVLQPPSDDAREHIAVLREVSPTAISKACRCRPTKTGSAT